MDNYKMHPQERELTDRMTTDGAALMNLLGVGSALLPIGDAGHYVVVGTPAMIAKMLPAEQPAAAQEVRAVPDLHDEIMRIPCNPPSGWGGIQQTGYKIGHRDARHAAAELTAAASAPAALDEVRNQALEEAASACEARGNSIVQNWTVIAGNDENARSIIEDAKARAWDLLQTALTIRALKTTASASTSQGPTQGDDEKGGEK